MGGEHAADGPPVRGGERFGPYRLDELLGRGGMGEVWRAYDTRRQRVVAIKRLTSGWADLPEFQARFRLEARATASLNSEHVIVIHDYGEIDGQLFIDMRLVTGGDLAELMEHHPEGLGPARAVNLCTQIADGLGAAHHGRLVHRDVKPSNILLAPDAGQQRAYLVDFGIAKIADELTTAGFTATGATLGTPAYMAPELFGSDGAASVASDVYALGCVLFQMLTGRRVFLGATSYAIINQHLHETPPTPSSVRPDLAPFDRVVARVLAKNPEQRHPSAAALAEDVNHAAHSPGRFETWVPPSARRQPGAENRGTEATGPVSPDSNPRSSPRRRSTGSLAIGAVLLIALGLAVGIVGSHWSTGDTRSPVSSAPAAPVVTPGPVTLGLPERLPEALQSSDGIVFSPDGRRAYIGDLAGKTVIVADTATGDALSAIPVDPGPGQIASTPDGRRLYVTNDGPEEPPGRSVSVIDTTTNGVTATIPVGSGPLGIVISPDGRRAYVANYGNELHPDHTVSVIDTGTNTVVATVPVGDKPARLAVSPDGSRVYVAGTTLGPSSSTFAIIDTSTNVPSFAATGDTNPSAVLASADGRHVYLLCRGADATSGSVQVYDTVAHTIAPLGANLVNRPLTAALSPDGRTLIVPNYGVDSAPGNTVSVIDTATGVTRSITLDGRPDAAAVAPDGRSAWVTTAHPGGLWRIPLK